MLKVENLYKSFAAAGSRHGSGTALSVLRGVDLEVAQGEVVSILGPSGAGKSTLLRCINFLERAEKGTILLEDYSVDVRSASKQDILYMRRHTAMVFQSYNLFQNRTALENVMEGLLIRKLPPKEAADKSRYFLDKVGMLEKADEYPARLSGGQQQRVGIARALALNPSIILLDEPTSALDPELAGEVLKVIRDMVQARMTMLIVTHEIDFGREISDRVYLLDDGGMVESNTTDEFFNNPQKERTIRFLERYTQSFTQRHK
ncbi:MAG: amino acid ABC transporter ATP-binding protein [Oscillospiraceae bacterium]|jgi:ABC-type polar amino acid transport system ATPase subunit|nr:amino acid ABC transporter ATP-binding protein [Oscillospiraceae bacterium]